MFVKQTASDLLNFCSPVSRDNLLRPPTGILLELSLWRTHEVACSSARAADRRRRGDPRARWLPDRGSHSRLRAGTAANGHAAAARRGVTGADEAGDAGRADPHRLNRSHAGVGHRAVTA